MIYHRLTLHHFGAYQGRHSFDLTIKPERPIILFLGLNGSGKTTLLTALQLTLFGRYAEPAVDFGQRGGCSYEDYLSGWINHKIDQSEGASLELEFTHTLAGVPRPVRIIRAWRKHLTRAGTRSKRQKATDNHVGCAEEPSIIRETLDVLIDGQRDNHLSNHWDDSVDEFLPRKLAPLFFFDGERLDAWSSPELRTTLISDCLQELMGLEVIDRTLADLANMQREYSRNSAPLAAQVDLDAHRNVIAQKEGIIGTLVQQEAQANDEVHRREMMLRKAEANLEERGGRLWQQRNELQALLSAAESRLNLARQQIHIQKLETDRRRRDWTDFLQLTHERDAALLAAISPELHSSLTQILDTHTLPLLPPEVIRQKATNSKAAVKEMPGALRDPAGVADEAATEVSRLTDLLSRVPEDFEVTPLLSERESCATDLQQSRFRLYEISGQLSRHRTELERAKAMVQRETEAFARELRLHHAAIRSLTDCEAVRTELTGFRQSLVERHTQAISRLITHNYQSLLHKKTLLFEKAAIVPLPQSKSEESPSRFTLLLLKGGTVVDADRFSAGEKQLLAIALIWSLSQASNISVPVVIDTPLGRLDSAHRQAVIDDYLPAAATQVLVFSTDEEIDPDQHPNLPTSRVIKLGQSQQSQARKKRIDQPV